MLRYRVLFLVFFIGFSTVFAQSDSSFIKLEVHYICNNTKEIARFNLTNLPLDQQSKLEHEHFSVLSNAVLSKNFQLELVAKTKITLENIEIHLPHKQHPHFQFSKPKANKALFAYYCNGFQSWTTSQELGIDDKIKNLWGLLKPYGQHLGDYNHYYKYPHKKGILHAWSFTYKRFEDEYAFVGSLNEETGYTLFVHNAHQESTRIRKDCAGLKLAANQTFKVFSLLFQKGSQEEIWAAYTQSFGKNPSKAKPAIGWTSWYNYYTKIDTAIIQENLNNFAKEGIPLDIFQIDDGYQSAIGDWLTCNDKFPDGMQPISKAIHQKGYQAGLWLAPFVASKKSKIFQEHPDWFVQDKKGRPIRVAINVMWKGPYYSLDIYNPAVQAHLKKVIQTILYDWEFDMIKVDFLFAVCLQARPDKTRGQIMYDAMKLLREYAGDKLILGCGVPLAPSFHLVDYCRVGNDAHLGWEFGILKAVGNAERPSTWSTLTNTIMRYPLSENLFLNDPDVFILRKENTKLSDAEKYTMLLLNNILGAVIFNSDNIGNYDSLQMQQYKSIFPYVRPEKVRSNKHGQGYTINFEVKNRQYLMLNNLGKKSTAFQVPNQVFFDAKKIEILDFSLLEYSSLTVDAHASRLLYQLKGDAPLELLGGNNHLISGQEIDNFQVLASNSLRLSFKEKAQSSQDVLIYVQDKDIDAIYVNGHSCPVQNQIACYNKEKHD